MNWKTIWRVPAITVIGGYIGWYVLVRLLTFAVVTQPDGTITSDVNRQLLIYGVYTVLFVCVMGMLFLRNISRKDIFQSATIVVLFVMLMTAVSEWVGPLTGPAAAKLIYLYMPFEWMDFPRTLLYRITGEYTLVGSILRAFMPYLFVFFGKKTENLMM